MAVTCPSTCGMSTADSRDFSVAMYSVESLTGTFFASCTLTGMPADIRGLRILRCVAGAGQR